MERSIFVTHQIVVPERHSEAKDEHRKRGGEGEGECAAYSFMISRRLRVFSLSMAFVRGMIFDLSISSDSSAAAPAIGTGSSPSSPAFFLPPLKESPVARILAYDDLGLEEEEEEEEEEEAAAAEAEEDEEAAAGEAAARAADARGGEAAAAAGGAGPVRQSS
jgi:hypothetical protein